MGYTRMFIKKSLEKFLQKVMFSKKCFKDFITGVQGKAIKKTKETNFLHKKSFSQKTIPKF